ncbi:MAG: hypothetical protein M1829_004097 [Trizodia sp. TS-e1964]|nr:MAG: hypothetical protein M1829_004097 [Trizodia sp. TS-e1964]
MTKPFFDKQSAPTNPIWQSHIYSMAATQKLYPRTTIKRIVKAHTKKSVTKNVDVLIFLDYAVFLQTLMREAAIHAKQTGKSVVSARDLKKVTGLTLRKFKG